MQVRLAVAGTILCSFMQCAAAQGPPLVGTASAMPSSPVDEFGMCRAESG